MAAAVLISLAFLRADIQEVRDSGSRTAASKGKLASHKVGASHIFVSLNHQFVDLALNINFYLCPCVCVFIHTPHIGMQLEAKGVHHTALSRSNRQL